MTTATITTTTTMTKVMSVLLLFLFSFSLLTVTMTVTSTTVVTSSSSSSSSSASSSSSLPLSTLLRMDDHETIPSAAIAAVASIDKMFHRDGNSNSNSNSNNRRRRQQQQQQQHQGGRQAVAQQQDDEDTPQNDYVNWMEVFDPQNDSTVSTVLQQLTTYLNSTNAEGNLAVNDLLRQFLPSSSSSKGDDEDSSSTTLSFEIGEGGFVLELGAASVITLQRVTVGGLDTFESLNLLQPVTALDGYDSPETIIQNNFVLKKLTLELELLETITAEDGTTTTTNPVLIRLPFDDVTFVSVPIRLALWKEALQHMPLGALLQYQEFLMPCLQQIIQHLELIELEIDFGTIQAPILMNSTTAEGSTRVTSSPFYEMVKTLFVALPQAVPVFFNSTIRELVNERLVGLIEGSDDGSACPSYGNDNGNDNDNDNDEFIDFRTFLQEGVPAMVMNLIDDQLMAINPETGLPKMNTVVIEPMLESMNQKKKKKNGQSSSSSLTFGDHDDNLFDFSTYIGIGGLQADIKMSLRQLQLNNLNTMTTPMEMLQTVEQEPYQLNNTMTMGLPIEDRPMSVRLNNLYFAVLTEGTLRRYIEQRYNYRT